MLGAGEKWPMGARASKDGEEICGVPHLVSPFLAHQAIPFSAGPLTFPHALRQVNGVSLLSSDFGYQASFLWLSHNMLVCMI